MRRAAKVDLSQQAITTYLRDRGWFVWLTHTVGQDGPDAVACRLGHAFFLEIKSGTPDQAERKLTEGQREFRSNCQAGYVVAATPEQAEEELAARLLGLRLDGWLIDDGCSS